MAQLAARQEQQDQNRHKPSSSSSLSLPGAALPGPTTNTDGVPFVAQPPNNRRAGTTEAAAVDLAVGKGVREGFDLNIREQSNKPQQVRVRISGLFWCDAVRLKVRTSCRKCQVAVHSVTASG